ncbi:MAG: alpha/beta-hydrolase family protein [Pseudoclavibacter sp.]
MTTTPRQTLTRVAQRIFRVLSSNFDLVGLVIGLNLFWASLTPSLMPRSWYWQGLISGILVVIGYGLGTLLGHIVRALISWRPSKALGQRVSLACLTIVMVVNVYWLSIYVWWQDSVYPLSGFTRPQLSLVQIIGQTVLIVLMTIAVAWGILLIVRIGRRAISTFWRFLMHRSGIRRMPPFFGRTVAFVVVVVALALVFDTSVRPTLLGVMDSFYTTKNDRDAGLEQPTDPLRSGSDASLVSWNSLGWPGKTFVQSGPSTDEIQSFNPGQPTVDPIRVYVGKEFSNNISEQARITVKELERTDAFDRQALQIVVTTGTGWVDTQSTRPLEYLYNGDVATVSMQYSFLPSALSFVFDRDRVEQTARSLITGVREAVDRHEAQTGHRPKLFVYAQSLGAYGTQNAFPDLSDLVSGTDGIVFAGTPGISETHQRMTAMRNGSPCVETEGQSVLFVERREDIDAVCAGRPRLMYMQNVSDPVVKWQSSLIWREPDWVAAEKAKGQLTPYFTWMPGVTYLQMTLDMLISGWAPALYGHNYGSSAVPAWQRLSGVQWDDARTDRLMDTIR